MWTKIICCCTTPKVQRVDEGEWFEPVLPKKRKKHNFPQSSRPRSDKLRTRSDKILLHQCRSSMNNSSSRSSRLSSMKQLSPLLEEEDTSLTEESSSSGSDSDEHHHQMYMNDNTNKKLAWKTTHPILKMNCIKNRTASPVFCFLSMPASI